MRTSIDVIMRITKSSIKDEGSLLNLVGSDSKSSDPFDDFCCGNFKQVD